MDEVLPGYAPWILSALSSRQINNISITWDGVMQLFYIPFLCIIFRDYLNYDETFV